jgi:5-methylcytosine-specific restriction endonuclease McrA
MSRAKTTLARWNRSAEIPEVKAICDLLSEHQQIPECLMTFTEDHSKAVRRGMGIRGVQYYLNPTPDGLKFVRTAGAASIPRRLRGQISQNTNKAPSGQKPKKVTAIKIVTRFPVNSERQAFYVSHEWRELRYLALRKNGGKCQCCGRSAKDGTVIHVDHVKPISKYPELKLSLSNLQVLCEDCNLGKGAWDETDWRETG